MGGFNLRLLETWWSALSASPAITAMLAIALMGIGWMIRGAFAKVRVAELTAHIAAQDQLIVLLKDQQTDAAEKADDSRRRIVTIAARPEAQYSLKEALKEAVTSATKTTLAVSELGTTLARVVLRKPGGA